jgi:hypothetical protein
MNNEFVQIEQALALKELGFDKENSHLKAVDQHWGMSISGISKKSGYELDDLILAPTYLRAFRWFREEYGLYSTICYIFGGCRYYIEDKNKNYHNDLQFTDNYVELECLKKLIDITISAKQIKTKKVRQLNKNKLSL